MGSGSGGVATLQSDDNSYYVVTSSQFGSATDWYGTLSGLPASPASLQIGWVGKASITCSATTYAWRWSTNSWVTVNSRSLGTSEVSVSATPSGALSSYVSGGTMRVRIRCSLFQLGSFTNSTDLLRVTYS